MADFPPDKGCRGGCAHLFTAKARRPQRKYFHQKKVGAVFFNSPPVHHPVRLRLPPLLKKGGEPFSLTPLLSRRGARRAGWSADVLSAIVSLKYYRLLLSNHGSRLATYKAQKTQKNSPPDRPYWRRHIPPITGRLDGPRHPCPFLCV